MKFAIVTIGYNRVNSMKRLITSLLNADYESDSVDLIISIDNSGNDDVENYAKSVIWDFGNKIIKTYPERLGLRRHVLTCGDYVYEYDAIAVLEDDIFVAPTFYTYMKQAVMAYKDDERIAGISLYSHLWSEYNRRPFTPVKTKYDNYFLQYAQSWGQVWMPKQWENFRDWYASNSGEIIQDEKTPEHIVDWPKTSWLKYHIKFCIAQNKFFVYPYHSFTTNFVEIGQHCKTSNTVYQVPMAYGFEGEYRFAKFGDKDAVYYDAFFERIFTNGELSNINGEVEIDLYGNKKIWNSAQYLLTSKRINKKVVQSYGLQLRPQEMNVVCAIPGNDLFLYDLRTDAGMNASASDFDMSRWYYDSRIFEYNYIIRVLIKVIKSKVFKGRGKNDLQS